MNEKPKKLLFIAPQSSLHTSCSKIQIRSSAFQFPARFSPDSTLHATFVHRLSSPSRCLCQRDNSQSALVCIVARASACCLLLRSCGVCRSLAGVPRARVSQSLNAARTYIYIYIRTNRPSPRRSLFLSPFSLFFSGAASYSPFTEPSSHACIECSSATLYSIIHAVAAQPAHRSRCCYCYITSTYIIVIIIVARRPQVNIDSNDAHIHTEEGKKNIL